MPTRNVNLTSAMDEYVHAKIQSGQYANASEVVRAGLRALDEDEKEDAARLVALQNALQAGEDSGVAPDGGFDRIFDYIDKVAAEKTNIA